MGLFDRLFGRPLSPRQRTMVVRYLSITTRLRAKYGDPDSDDSDYYDRMMTQWLARIGSDPRGAGLAVESEAKQIMSMAREQVNDHRELRRIPSVARECHSAWEAAHLALANWSVLPSTLSYIVIPALQVVPEDAPSIFKLTELQAADHLNAFRQARRAALKAEARLMERARVSAEEVRRAMVEES